MAVVASSSKSRPFGEGDIDCLVGVDSVMSARDRYVPRYYFWSKSVSPNASVFYIPIKVIEN